MGKVTYHGYDEGYDTRVLHLGNLAFDFTEPKKHGQYIHPEISLVHSQISFICGIEDTKSRETHSEPELLDKWATSDERPVCYMASQDGRNFSFGLGLQDYLDFHSSRSGNSCSLVVGKDGSKVELIEPEAFFEQVVLTNDDARFWLESRLAVVRKLQILRGYLGLTPKMWLLTGLYLITDAVTFSAYGSSSESAIGGAVPLPEPTQLTALLNLNIGSKVKLGRNAVVARGTQISGKKVWAAQWQRVDANYMSVAKWKDDMGVKRLKLLPLFSTQTVRAAPLEEQAAAEVMLAGDEETKAEGATDAMPSEEYWGLLDREVQKVEDDYADDDDEDNA